MSRAKYTHEHIYKAINRDKRVYKCTIQGCPHSINASLMIGRKATCANPNCGAILTVTPDHLIRQNITCIGCGTAFGSAKGLRPKTESTKPLNVADLLSRASDVVNS